MPRTSHSILVQRRKQVAEYHLRGLSQAAIAEKLGVRQGTVSRDLKALCKEWRASSLRDFDAARGEVLRKLDRIERAAWDAWDASRAPGYAAQYSTEKGTEVVKKHIRHREGETKYLDVIQKCLIQRRAIMGLDAQPAEEALPVETHVDIQESNAYVLAYYESLTRLRRITGPKSADQTAPAAEEPGDICTGGQQRALETGPAPDAARPDAARGN